MKRAGAGLIEFSYQHQIGAGSQQWLELFIIKNRVFVDNLLHVFRAKTEARLLPPPFVVVRYDKFEGLLVGSEIILDLGSYMVV